MTSTQELPRISWAEWNLMTPEEQDSVNQQEKQAFELKKEEVWDWRWLDGQTRKVFRVTYDFNGKVLNAASLDDPRDVYQGSK